MVKYLLSASIVVIVTTSAQAGCVGPVVAGRCAGATVDSPYVGTATGNDSGYQGSSGSSYQYDLNSPSDRNGYSTDLSAQRRDSQSLDLGRTLDQGLGQDGGGIYDN